MFRSKMAEKLKKMAALFIAVVFMSQTAFAAEAYKSREEIPHGYKWDLTHMYKTQADWEKDLNLCEDEYIPKVAAYKGKLGDKKNVLACLKADTELSKVLGKAYGYAMLNMDVDMGDPAGQELMGRVWAVYQKAIEASAYITPEISRKDESVIKGYIADPDFKEYAGYLEIVLAEKEHILSEAESELLAKMTSLSRAPEEIFGMINNVDIAFDPVKDSEGNEYEVTHGSYGALLENPDRELRKAAQESCFSAYMALNNTLAAVLSADVNKSIFYARAQNYVSALDWALEYGVPRSVYENLITSVNKGLSPLHKYISLRKEALGLEHLYGYDLYAPLIPMESPEIGYEDSKKIVTESLKPLGEDYAALLKKALNENWIDVYETPGKRNGAYAYQAYGSHPFVLLNYSGSASDISTLSHELGHAMHMYYSTANQSFNNSEAAIFTSEVASTVNEILTLRYMADNAGTNAEKLYCLAKLADLYDNAFYYQTMLAEFEKDIHETVEAGGILNADTLNDKWFSLTKKYQGDSYETTEYTPVGWSRIPHFYYYDFYVYNYATSISAANKIASGILEQKPGALNSYLEFLRSGSKDDPIVTLANAGVDMNSPVVFEECVKEFESIVNEMETLMRAEGLIE